MLCKDRRAWRFRALSPGRAAKHVRRHARHVRWQRGETRTEQRRRLSHHDNKTHLLFRNLVLQYVYHEMNSTYRLLTPSFTRRARVPSAASRVPRLRPWPPARPSPSRPLFRFPARHAPRRTPTASEILSAHHDTFSFRFSPVQAPHFPGEHTRPSARRRRLLLLARSPSLRRCFFFCSLPLSPSSLRSFFYISVFFNKDASVIINKTILFYPRECFISARQKTRTQERQIGGFVNCMDIFHIN